MDVLEKPFVAVVGGGPAGLMAAEVLSRDGACRVVVFEAMPSAGRKFLMAGRGGLNLTHSEPLSAFLARYGEREDQLRPVIAGWSPDDVRAWCEALGQETFVGSSGRVFPKIMKASGLLRAWLRRLGEQGVELRTRHRWTGWCNDGGLAFETPDGVRTVEANAVVLALGGASWPRLGSDGGWVALLQERGVEVVPLAPANSGFVVAWSDVFRSRFEGQPLKSIAMSHGAETARGEAVITAGGIEGGAVYAISAALRRTLSDDGAATLMIDLKPDVEESVLVANLSRPRGKQSMATFLRKTARLSPVAIGLMQEFALAEGVRLGDMAPAELARMIKELTLPVAGIAPIDKAISSAGGVSFDEIDARYMLRRMPGVFVAGEMLDWEGPTGGYLLQACFATGVAAGHGVCEWLESERAGR